ncbi:unnamed protein product [Arabidopsis lyrata]|nr:unnamed protein product [Arabidopsis lyrata]
MLRRLELRSCRNWIFGGCDVGFCKDLRFLQSLKFFFAECYLSFGCGFWWAGFVFEVCQSDGTSLQVALIGLLCPRVRVGAPLWLILSRFQRSIFVPSFVRAHYPSEVGVMVLVAVLAS